MDLTKQLAKLREERAANVEARKALLAKAASEERGVDDNETDKAEYANLETRGNALSTELARVEALIEEERKTQAQRIESGNTKTDRNAPRAEVRVRASRRALELMGGKANEERAYRMGMWTRAAIYGDAEAARWVADHEIDTRAHNEAEFSAGGVLVPEEFSSFIIDLREQYGLARQLVRVVPMGRDTLTIGRRTGGVTAYFVAEGASFTESEKGWDGVTLTAKKMGALAKMSLELAADAVIDVAADLANEMAYAFAQKEDDCWLNGTGTSTYGGIWGIRSKIIDGTHTQGAIDAASGHDTFAEIDADDLGLLRGRLPVYAERGARWLCSKFAKAQVFDALAVAAGGNTIMTVGERPRPTYLGDPIEVSQVMPAASTAYNAAAMLLYGDFAMASTMGDRSGFAVQVLRELYAANGQIGVLGFERFDIVNHDMGDTTNAGPVVALLGKT